MSWRSYVELVRAPAALSVPGDVVAGSAASRTLGPRTAGLVSSSGSNSLLSWVLAADSITCSGSPFASHRRWYFDPALPRSVGFGPVSSPPFSPGR